MAAFDSLSPSPSRQERNAVRVVEIEGMASIPELLAYGWKVARLFARLKAKIFRSAVAIHRQ